MTAAIEITRIRTRVRTERAALSRRILLVILALAVTVVLLFCVSLMLGSVLLSPAAVVGGLTGTGETATVFVIRELRLPRATAAVLVGLALGAAGTLFQRVLGNPLASPDFLGVAAGAGTATAAALVLGGVAGVTLPVYALIGGSVTAVVIYVVAWHRGVSEYRFILVGIGVGTFATSVTSYLVARAEFADARAAMTWLTGSVGMATPETITLVAVVLVVLVPSGFALARMLRRLELGDETARMLGARVERDRLLILAAGVVLVSVATATVGPIAFISMLAGPLAQILLGAAGRSILAAALMGAVILQIADILAQHALPWPISTGVVTGIFGAPYIAWMLISAARRTRVA
ncbi:iron chelate uptake ABC transporter family permease subunit [Microbacterium aoyamense]|uniref:Iron chelate uptake ABC transporter family permease subunit n=1 Tax=Microbacterium aoyamense TaxID=344166 RepID=A0ABN2PQQ6_9MICO|nr:iron chelate uptake ABC transporter family permease subunit [Microbacterium aoyamense]